MKKKVEETRFPNAYLVDKSDPSKGWDCVAQCNFFKANGQPKRIKRHGKTKREAENRAYAARDEAEKLHKRQVEQKNDFRKTLGSYMDDYLSNDRLKNVDGNTALEYVTLLKRTFYKNAISKYQIRQLDFSVFDCYYRNLVKNNCRSAYNTTRQILNGLCEYLVFLGILEENYSAMVKTKWERREEIKLDENGEIKEKECLTEEDIEKLITYMRQEVSRFTPMFIFQMETMAREGEIFALQINDVDLENNIVYFRHAISTRLVEKDLTKIVASKSTKNTERYVKSPKNGEGRIAKLSPLAREAYDLAIKDLAKCPNNPMGLLFPTRSTGSFLSYANYQNNFKDICDKLGIYRPKGLGPHRGCRATGVTMANGAEGASVTNVALMAGHKDLRTNFKYYTKQNEQAIRNVKTPGELLEEKNARVNEEEIEKELLKKLIKKYGVIF